MLLLLSVGFLLKQLGLFDRTREGDGIDPKAQPRPVAARGDLWPEEARIVELYDRVKPSAVTVFASAMRWPKTRPRPTLVQSPRPS